MVPEGNWGMCAIQFAGAAEVKEEGEEWETELKRAAKTRKKEGIQRELKRLRDSFCRDTEMKNPLIYSRFGFIATDSDIN